MVFARARLRTCLAVLGFAAVVAMPQAALSDPATFIALQGPDSHTVYTAAAAGEIRVHVCVADLQGATQVEVRVLNSGGDHSYDVMALGPDCDARFATLDKGQAIAIWLRRGDCGEIPAGPGDSAKAIYDIRAGDSSGTRAGLGVGRSRARAHQPWAASAKRTRCPTSASS